jgi:hypothetical protein
MWHLEECDHLLYVHLGEDNILPDAKFTLNPYAFIENMNEN